MISMLKWLKKSIKQIPWLYKSLIFCHSLFLIIIPIKFDFHAAREFFYLHIGLVGLSKANYRLYSNSLPLLVNLFGSDQVVILDVGANDGWFAKVIFRFCGPAARIISFEPLISTCAQLTQLKSRYPNYHFENMALGATEGSLMINEHSISGLSSLKDFSDHYHYPDAFHETSSIHRYPVSISSLDNYLIKKQLQNPLILKIDTQGYEYEVLLGAHQALISGQVKVVIIEVMTIEKYQQSKLYSDIFQLLQGYGFRLFDLSQSYYELDGSLSEIDCIFIKN